MSMSSRSKLMSESWHFLREQKKLFLLPIVVFLVILGLLLVFAQASALSPFVYSLF